MKTFMVANLPSKRIHGGKQLKLLNVTVPEVEINKEIHREKTKQQEWKRQDIKEAKKTEGICMHKGGQQILILNSKKNK